MKNVKVILLTSTFLIVFSAALSGQTVTQQWKKGDWWTIQVSQKADWTMQDEPTWVEAGKWKFEVTQTGEKGTTAVQVVDLDRPANAKQWDLKLLYGQDGKLQEVTYQVGRKTFRNEQALRYLPMGKEGLEIQYTAQQLRSAPRIIERDILDNTRKQFIRLERGETQAYQLWLPDESWWRYYQKSEQGNVRAELVGASWRE